MKVLKIVFFMMLFVGFNQLNAQTTNNEKLKTEAEKVVAHRKAVKSATKAPNSIKSKDGVPYVDNNLNNTLNENDMYMGRKAEFLNNLTVSELPADFPKYDKSYGLGGYNVVLDNYYAQHTDILKPGVKAKIESSHTSK